MKNPIRATPALPTDSAELAALRQVFEPHFLSTGISPERLAYDPLERLANGQYFYTHAQRAWEAFLLGFGIGRRPASAPFPVDVPSEVRCACVSAFGPHPDCGACGGDGVVPNVAGYCDRAALAVQRATTQGWIQGTEPGLEQLTQTIRIALDTEVAAGGPRPVPVEASPVTEIPS